jgi:type II secretory pathway component PulM
MKGLSRIKLSNRERRIIIVGGIAAAILFLIFGWVNPTLQRIERLDRAIAQERRELQEVRQLYSAFEALGSREAQAQEELENRTLESFSIASVIEGMARESKIQDRVQYLKPDQTPFSDAYQEVSVSLKVTEIQPDQMVDFLYRIESSNDLLRVRSLQIRSNPKEKGTLDITLTVFTLLPAESA